MIVHVVGNICRDTTFHVARFPSPGETLVATSSAVGIGGKGVNQAVAAARTGARVAFYAAAGRVASSFFADALAEETNLTPFIASLDQQDDASVILVRDDGENSIVSATGCAARFDPFAHTDFGHAIEAGDIVLLQGNLAPDVTAACLAHGRKTGALTILNPSPLQGGDLPPWADIDLLVGNAGELRTLSHESDPRAGALALRARGVGAAAVTLGRQGALHLDAAGWIAVDAPEVAICDTSGAGDVFCGVLVASIAGGAERGEALARATAAASLSVTRAGALASCPSAEEIRALTPAPITRSVS